MMLRVARPAWLRYCFALVVVVVVTEARILMESRMAGMEGPPFTMMLMAVIAAAAFGGVGPGMFASFIGAAICDYRFIEPRGTLLGNNLGYDLRLGLFVIEGAFISWIIHALRRSSATTRQMERNLRLIADNTSDVIFAYDTAGHLLYVNPAFETLTGHSISELRENPFMNYVHPDDSLRMQDLFGSLFQGKAFKDVEYRIISHDGEIKWCRASWGPLLDEFANQIGVQGRETDITEQRLSEAKLRFLSESCAVLAENADAQTTLTKLARAAVPQYADYCMIDLLNGDGTAQTVAAVHADASKQPWVNEIQRDFPPLLDETAGRGRVLATGQPEIVPVVEADGAALARGPRHAKLLHNLTPRSRLTVPLRSEARVIGSIMFVSSALQRRYNADDLIFATDLARRVVESLDAAKRFPILESNVQATRNRV